MIGEDIQYRELHYVPYNDWPFQDMPVQDGLESANRLAPDNCHWSLRTDHEPGFMLLKKVDSDD